MGRILKGIDVANAIDEELVSKMTSFYEKNIVPTLAIVRVGDNPSDIAYENGAVKKAKKVGVQTEKFTCDGKIEQDDLIAVLNAINDDPKIHGVLLLQPLPAHLDADAVKNAISPEKDLDCVSESSLAMFLIGSKNSFAPCTAESCLEILKHNDIPLTGKNVVVIGRSLVIGRPAALLMLRENATVTICHSRTPAEEMKKKCLDADIIISAAGHINTVTAEMVRPGQTVIDVGINFNEEGKMVGDVDFDNVWETVDAITPVPRGVGSVTTSVLMKHLADAAENQIK